MFRKLSIYNSTDCNSVYNASRSRKYTDTGVNSREKIRQPDNFGPDENNILQISQQVTTAKLGVCLKKKWKERLFSKETVTICRRGSKTGKFGFKQVDRGKPISCHFER